MAFVQRAILHVDMDAFYASVEQRDNPKLQGKPVIVGGHPTRGVVLAASYEVRPFGVRSAMPMSRAVRACPHAVVVQPRFTAYAEASEEVFEIFSGVTPLIEPLSLDEAFLDVSASVGLFGAPAKIARELRERIAREVRLPASAGIAEVKFAAKVASDLAKPNGQLEVPVGRTREFLAPLPVGRLWGVGPKTDEVLKGLGLRTIGEVANHQVEWLFQRLGDLGRHLWELSNGIDEREVVPDRGAKSIGAEDTFHEDLEGAAPLEPHLHAQALRVGRRLRRAGVKTRVVQLKLKYSDFTTVTRRATLDSPTDDGQRLYREAVSLLSRAPLDQRVRLTGVSAQDLGGAEQLPLFDGGEKRRGALNAALDRIADKYGRAAVITADLAGDTPEDDEEDDARRSVGASRVDAKKAPSGGQPGR
ncbi:MAG: DNA polymerase IV [Myxococcaceae bacterium]